MGTAITLGSYEQFTDALGEIVPGVVPQRRGRAREIGELRLMVAVLEDAVHVLRKRPRSRAGREAREWMISRDTTWPFAYERICEALEMDPNAIRHEVLTLKVVRLAVAPLEFRLAEVG